MPDIEGLSARQKAIVQDLREHGFVSTTDLAEKHRVSDMTIRRDARALSGRGVARSVHGGLMLPHDTQHGAGFAARADEESDAKKRIARACLDLLEASDRVFIDAGTTAYGIARALPASFGGTIITHSAPVMQAALHLREATTIALGGELLHDSQAFVGDMAISNLEGLRAETAFIGVAGVTEHGFYIERSLELATKRAIMAAADRVVVVAAGSKVGRSELVHLGELSDIDVIVTDTELAGPIARAIRDAGIEVVHAEGSEEAAERVD